MVSVPVLFGRAVEGPAHLMPLQPLVAASTALVILLCMFALAIGVVIAIERGRH